MSDPLKEGMRVVYAGTLHGTVLHLARESPVAWTQLDNGTLDWLRTDQMVPEGDHDPQEPTPASWRDRAGFLWLEAEPGSGLAFCYDAPVRRRMSDKWPLRRLEEIETEFGPLDRMVPEEPGTREAPG